MPDWLGVTLGVRLDDEDCDGVMDMKKSAMRRLFTVLEATPASLSSQDEYAEKSAPLVYPLAGITLVTFARR